LLSELAPRQKPPSCDDCSDDFEFITREDLPIQLDGPSPPSSGLPSDRSRTGRLPSSSLHRTSLPSILLRKFSSTTRASLPHVSSYFKKRQKRAREIHRPPLSFSPPAGRGRDLSNLGDRLKAESLANSTPKFSVEFFQVSPSPTEPSSLPPLYECVNPLEFTTSPSPLLGSELLTPSARTSFIPPSPSWLSRNVREPESLQVLADHGTFSPKSLPNPPRILISSDHSETPPLSPLEATEGWFNRSLQRSRSLTSLRSRRSSTSSTKCSVNTDNSSSKENRPDSKSLLFQCPGSSSSAPILGVHKSAIPSPAFASRFPIHTSFPVTSQALPPSTANWDIFIPASRPSEQSESGHDLIPLPEEIWRLFGIICTEAGFIFTGMDYSGKRTDVVDFGGEVDYSDYAWFQDAPPKQPSIPQTVAPPYVPLPGVIEQNEAFEFALSAAPNVLYARYKQYGQLGVLAWCSEFSELIDNLKELGFQGNMFVTTRTQALRTCEELLKLNLDVKMQIIVMYLSSQVARLRRFLDGDRQWDDYPAPQFPLEPRSYT